MSKLVLDQGVEAVAMVVVGLGVVMETESNSLSFFKLSKLLVVS